MVIYNKEQHDQLNEHNQTDAIKRRSFVKNGKALVAIGAIFGILVICALVGWRWNSQQQRNSARAALQYEKAVSAIRANHSQELAAAEKFLVDNKNSYGALAALEVAQQYADQNELDKAAVQLQHGLAAAGDDNLKAIINLRLARIQIQQKKADEALKTLAAVKGEGFA